MADARPFALYDGDGVPVTGATPTVEAWDVTGTPRTPPPVLELGAGLYHLLPTDLDESVGTVCLVTTGHEPSHYVVAAYLPDGSNQFFAWAHFDEAGALWAGAPPTFGAWDDAAGAARTPPSILAVRTGVYVAVPSGGDVAADCAGRIDAPAGASPEFIVVGTVPLLEGFGAPPTPPPDYAAGAVLSTLAGVVALPPPASGSVELTPGDGGNLLLGPPRSTEGGVPQLAVFVLQSGGAAPVPYLGAGESWHETSVQVVVRSAAHDFATGEALARALLSRAHLAEVAGFTFLRVVESDPNYLGTDDGGVHRWSLNVRVGHRR